MQPLDQPFPFPVTERLAKKRSSGERNDGYSIMRPWPNRGGPWQTRSLTTCPITPKKILICIQKLCGMLFPKHTIRIGLCTRSWWEGTRRTRMLARRCTGATRNLSEPPRWCTLCTYMFVYICIHVYKYICVYICVYIYMHTYWSIYTYIDMHAHVYTYILIYIAIREGISLRAQINSCHN